MFFDRYAAGVALAKKLKQFRNRDVVLYALPKGGVPVGYEVSRALNLPLDIVQVQKIGHPVSSTYGVCAVTEDGETLVDECGMCGLDTKWINEEVALQFKEIERRRSLYARGQASVSAEDKIAILIDDGMATGISMRAAIQAIEAQWPEQIIVATPVAPRYLVRELKSNVDGVIVLNDDPYFLGTVDAYYMDFSEVSDYEVMTLLNDAHRRQTADKNAHPVQETQDFIFA